MPKKRLSKRGDPALDGKRGVYGEVMALLFCRSLLTSRQLGQVLGQHPALEALKLCSCPRVTDEALELLPARCLKGLTLVCCDAVQGKPLYKLKKLETLEFSSCNAVTEQAIQVRAAAWPVPEEQLRVIQHSRKASSICPFRHGPNFHSEGASNEHARVRAQCS